ncbi:MAG: hypothetical protein Q9167_007695, partial [Letrouitia subvulpina]
SGFPDTAQGTIGSTAASYEIINTVPNFTVPKRTPELPCYMHKGHTRNPKFFGRMDELTTLAEALLPSGPTPAEYAEAVLKAYCICGLGGIGKTEIAVEFMLANETKYDAIFWLQGDNETKLREGFSQITIELNLEDFGANDQIASIDLVKAWLANPVKKPDLPSNREEARRLLIFDNVDNPDVLQDYWPQFGHGSVLITSRDPFAKSNLYTNMDGIDLNPFSDQDAVKFLVGLTHGRDVSSVEVSASALVVARKLGGLPLGLLQMAGIINRQDYTFEEFLRKYQERSLPGLLKSNAIWRPDGYAHTISSVWALEQLKEGSASLLNILAFLDPDAIPEDILRRGASMLHLPSYPADDDSYEDARFDLTKRSLVTRNKISQELRLHRLTQDATRAKMAPNLLR